MIHSNWELLGSRASDNIGTAKPSTVPSIEINNTGNTRTARPHQRRFGECRTGLLYRLDGPVTTVGTGPGQFRLRLREELTDTRAGRSPLGRAPRTRTPGLHTPDFKG